MCKRFGAKKPCKFKDKCAYHHKEILSKEENEIRMKINALEKVVTEMALQVIGLKSEISKMKEHKLSKEN